MTAPLALPLRIGARTVGTISRRLVRRGFTLAEALAPSLPTLPALPSGSDGYWLTSVPADRLPALRAACPRLRVFVRQSYQRCYAALHQDFDAYLAGFSAKSRSTLRRKQRKLAERSGGAIDLRCYRAPHEMEAFQQIAGALSARTYQERLLGAGLPQGEEALAGMRSLAEADAVRAWLLFIEDRPVSYLYAPAEGDTLIYAYLGYDPDFAQLSPGSVLQLEAMRQLMEEGRFAWFDFTEGEGQHKRQFATGAVDCVDLLLLRPSLSNLAAGHALNGFDGAVAAAKKGVRALRLERVARQRLR